MKRYSCSDSPWACRTSAVAPGDTELVLGYDLDGPPTFLKLVTDWRFDWVLGTAVIVAAVVYLLAVRRLSRRGVHWPPGRTVAWVSGCAMVLNFHSIFPVRTSKARTRPLVLLCVTGVKPSFIDEPTMATSLTMAGVE